MASLAVLKLLNHSGAHVQSPTSIRSRSLCRKHPLHCHSEESISIMAEQINVDDHFLAVTLIHQFPYQPQLLS